MSYLWLAFLSHSVQAQIYKCVDPDTQQINFTDKPCSNGHSQPSLSAQSQRIAQSADTYVELSANSLMESLKKAEGQLKTASSSFAVGSTLRSDKKSADLRQLDIILRDQNGVWIEYRNTSCLKQFFDNSKPVAENRPYLACKLRKTLTRIAEYSQFSEGSALTDILTTTYRVTVMPGKSGLQQALTDRLIELGKLSDIERWLEKSDFTSTSEIIEHKQFYRLASPIKLSGGFGGANSTIFIAENSTLIPTGDMGHSVVLIMDTGSCIGTTCSSYFHSR
jgi:uncharacterized protein YecT (DUF1311 family)